MKKAVFCVAGPNFDNEMAIKNVEYEEDYCNDLVTKIVEFWEMIIFTLLITEND